MVMFEGWCVGPRHRYGSPVQPINDWSGNLTRGVLEDYAKRPWRVLTDSSQARMRAVQARASGRDGVRADRRKVPKPGREGGDAFPLMSDAQSKPSFAL